LLLLTPAVGQTANVTFSFDSAGIGDFVGKGDSGSFTGADGDWEGFTLLTSSFGDVVIEFEEAAPGDEDWGLDFGALSGDELVPGVYDNAQGNSIQSGQPYIDVSRDGRHCGSGAVGSFEVFASQYDIYGKVMRFVADFEQACDDNDPLLTGDIDFSTGLTLGPTSFVDGNLLVVSKLKEDGHTARSLLTEYTTAGAQVQVLPFLREFGSVLDRELFPNGETVRHVVMDSAGRVHVVTADETSFDSTPFLSSFDPATGVWTHSEFADWDIGNSFRDGGVTAFGNFVFTVDDDPFSNPSGIVRWDADNGFSAVRFGDGTPYSDVAAGYDGLLYALRDAFGDAVDVFDPVSLASLGSINLDHSVLGIAVDARGRIFATASSGVIYELDGSGSELNSLATGQSGTFDIDLTRSGEIVVGAGLGFTPEPGVVILADVSLSSFTSFMLPDSVSDAFTYVGFVQPPPSPLFSGGDFESGDISAWDSSAGNLAGHLEVTADSASAGSFGLEVTVGGTCSAPDDLVIEAPPTIEGEFVACSTITASGVEVSGTGATFGAGTSITLGEDFAVGSGAPFEVTFDAGLLSGLAWVGDDSPSSATSYNADFDVRLDSLTIGDTDRIELFNGYSQNGDVQFQVILKRNVALAENRLIMAVRQDDGSFVETPSIEEVLLPASWNNLRISWLTGSGDGYLLVSVNGGVFVGLAGIDNDQQALDEVRLGYVGGTISSSVGFLEVDGFFSWL
jgi:hypothetical protein